MNTKQLDKGPPKTVITFWLREPQKAQIRSSHEASERSGLSARLQAAKLLALIQRTDLDRIDPRGLDRALAQLREMIEQSDAAGMHICLADDPSLERRLETAPSTGSVFECISNTINNTAFVRLQRFADDVKCGLNQLGRSEGQGWELWPPHGIKRIAFPGKIYLSGDGLFELALWKAQELLAGEFSNIKLCEFRKCRKLFIPIHGTKYCSVRCGQNTRAVTFKKGLSSDEKKELNRITYLRKLAPARAEIALSKWAAKEPKTAAALRAFYEKFKENTAKNRPSKTRASKPTRDAVPPLVEFS